MSNVLVTAIGSFAASTIIKTLQDAGHKVIGCDIYPKEWIADAYQVDSFHQVPYSTDKLNYVEALRDICQQHDVQFIFPLTDTEVDVLVDEKHSFKDQGISICISDERTIKICRDKYRLFQFLTEQGIRHTIPTKLLRDTQLEDLQFPVFMKPRSGRSSQGCRTVNDAQEFLYFKERLNENEYVVQPLLKGNVVTVDVVRDPKEDHVVCVSRLELLRNVSGAGTTVEVFEDRDLDEICIEIARMVGIIGAVNFEFIQNESGYHLLEINPRFSGGVVFSQLAGYDVVTNHWRCFQHQPIDTKNIKKMTIARKYTEYITRNHS